MEAVLDVDSLSTPKIDVIDIQVSMLRIVTLIDHWMMNVRNATQEL